MLLANDANAARCKAIVGNLHRLGITNTVVCNEDGRKLPGVMKGFDRVLLDAPCSGRIISCRIKKLDCIFLRIKNYFNWISLLSEI